MSQDTGKPRYGIDAPGVIRNLALIGIVCLIVGLLGPPILHLGPVDINIPPIFVPPGAGLVAAATLMLLYALRGKFAHRDRMLALHSWRGDEQVLDVGTGLGLLLVGAARKLTSGHAFGLDIWNKNDLSGNALELTKRNLALEGVAGKCTLVTESAAQTGFADATFDVVVSNLCLHNIYDRPTRSQACREIARVLKPGGVALISDYKLTSEYAALFAAAGLTVKRRGRHWLSTFPPLTIVVATRP